MRKDVGVDGDAQRISQLGWMLFLKIFDDQEKEKEPFEMTTNSVSRRNIDGGLGPQIQKGSLEMNCSILSITNYSKV